MSSTKTLTLDFDDLHAREPESCISAIEYLVDQVPNIKLSFFTIAELDGDSIANHPEWCSQISKFIESGRVRLGVHGLNHSFLEFGYLNTDQAREKIQAAEKTFQKANLPYAKVFKGPNWGINKYVYDALISEGYQRVFSHQDHAHLQRSEIETIIYNWNVGSELEQYPDNVVGHGHTWDVCGNGIDQCKERVVQFCRDYQPIFKFIDE